MNELEILKKQVEALTQLVGILNQTIQTLQLRPAQIQYVPYIQQQPSWQQPWISYSVSSGANSLEAQSAFSGADLSNWQHGAR